MATPKQLAALAKARAARAKKAGVKKVAVTAKSRATGKPPTARLKARRKKNLTAPAGYFPNPVKRKNAQQFLVEVKLRGNRVGYITGHLGLDTSITLARKMSEKVAEKVATEFFNENKRHLLHVRVIPAPK